MHVSQWWLVNRTPGMTGVSGQAKAAPFNYCPVATWKTPHLDGTATGGGFVRDRLSIPIDVKVGLHVLHGFESWLDSSTSASSSQKRRRRPGEKQKNISIHAVDHPQISSILHNWLCVMNR